MDESRLRLQVKTLWLISSVALVVFVVVAAFAFGNGPSPGDPDPSQPQVGVSDPSELYDPVLADEPLPDGYRQLLGRDMIQPVYAPLFADADEVDWADDTDVIGVAGVEEAKAYPVSHLNHREMVIDDIEGIPILVSW
jgi:hypothetical protein